MPDTAKIISLKGDPSHPESAEHIIEFPGGAISVCRTSDNEYWAHISINKNPPVDGSVRESKTGEIVGSRIDYEFPSDPNIIEVPNHDRIEHLAIRIKVTD